MRAAHPVTAALAASLLLIASGCADDATAPIPPAASRPSTTTGSIRPTATVPATTAVTIAPETAAPAATVAPTTTPTISAPVEVSAPIVDDPDTAGYAFVRWLLPWDDGFLAISEALEVPTLPNKLPAEAAALFPAVLTDLFPDGLPESRQDAYDIVVAAGLEDELMAVLDEHPEVTDLLNPRPIGPTFEAATTTDGTSWRRSELDIPGDMVEPLWLSSTDGRITMFGVQQRDDERPALVQVVTTRDLLHWDIDEFEVGEIDPESGVAPSVYPVALAANDDGWIVDVMIEREVADKTWSLDDGERWAANWDQPPARVATGIWPRPLVATSAGFVDLGDSLDRGDALTFSSDGISWTPVLLPEPDAEVVAAVPFEGGLLLVLDTPQGSVATYRVDPTLTTWEPLGPELDLGAEFYSVNEPTSPAFVLDLSQDDTSELWLFASGDGNEWLFQPYPEYDDGYPPVLAAASDTFVIVGATDWGWAPEEGNAQWLRFALPN